MNEYYLPHEVWSIVKSFMFPLHNVYTMIRNKYLIGNYGIKSKQKFGKRIDSKEYISNYHQSKNINTLSWTVFDDYWVSDLLLGTKYICIDEYIKIIKTHGIRCKNMNLDPNLYWKFRNHNNDFFDIHNGYEGPFYIAMIYMGFDFKIFRNKKTMAFAIKYI